MCTSKACSWLPCAREVSTPIIICLKCLSQYVQVSPAPIKDIDFKRCDHVSAALNSHSDVEPPSESEIAVFYKALDLAKTKPAILNITPPYTEQFIPHVCDSALSTPLSQLYNPDCLSVDYVILLKICEETFKVSKIK